MKVYRLVECTGCYDDYSEYRIGTYASKKKAQEVRKQQEQIAKEAEEQALLCQECMTCDDDYKDVCQKLCLSYKEVKGSPNDCANWSSYWEPATYRINEEEVIE